MGSGVKTTLDQLPFDATLGLLSDFSKEIPGLPWLWDEVAEPIIGYAGELLGIEDETIEHTFLTTLKLMDEPNLDYTKDAIYAAILQQRDLTKSIIESKRVGPVGYLHALAGYANSDYYFGSPEYSSAQLSTDFDTVVAILDSTVGVARTTEYIKYGYPEELPYVHSQLYTNWGWTNTSNTIVIDGANWEYTHYVKNVDGTFTVHATRTATTTTEDVRNTVIYTLEGIEYTKISLLTRYTYDNGTPAHYIHTAVYVSHTISSKPATGIPDSSTDEILNVVVDELVEFTITTYDIPAPEITEYYYAKYKLDSDPGTDYYFMEKTPSDTYPELVHAISISNFIDNKVMPVMPIVRDGVYIDTESPETVDSVRTALSIVSLDLTTLSDSIRSDGNIEDAFIAYGINVHTTSQAGMDALYSVFDVLEIHATTSKAEFEAMIVGNSTTMERKPNVTTYKESTYNFQLSFNYIERNLVIGNIGIVGTYSTEIELVPEVDYGLAMGVVFNDSLIIRKQVTDTQYLEIKVHGLLGLVYLRTNANTFKTNVLRLNDSSDMAKSNFNIPLTVQVFSDLTSDKQLIIAQEAVTFVIFGADTQVIDWYATDNFATLVKVTLITIAVIIAIVTVGSATSISAGLIALAVNVGVQLLLYLSMELALKYIDEDETEIRAFIRGIYVISSIFAAGYMSGGELFSAEALLSLVTMTSSMVSAEGNIRLGVEYNGLLEEEREFLSEEQERQEEFEAAMDLLGEPSGLSILDIQSRIIMSSNESPDEFYTRTVGISNPGIIAFYQLDNYHDIQLELPEPELN